MLGIVLAIGLCGGANAFSAKLAGVTLPETREAAGVQLVLNGIGLRTYSILGIRIYVAGLYLQHRSDNAQAILDSADVKLLEIHFLRDVSRDKSEQAWRSGFADNCTPPCSLDPQNVARFIAAVPAVHSGDVSDFLFTPEGLTVTFNGRDLGTITDRHFAREVLATFIGPVPPTRRLKRELLGG